MVNVQAFVTVMVVTASLSMVYLIMALIILVRISCNVDRIYHYSMDIYCELEKLEKDFCYLTDYTKKIYRASVDTIHLMTKNQTINLSAIGSISKDISSIKQHTEKIEKNSAIK